MSEPKTLLQMAGADPAPASLAAAAVVAIDCQREYVDGLLPLDGVEPALAAAAEVLARARAAGAPIIHVRHMGRAGGAFDPDGPGGEIHAAVAPLDGEPVVGKTLPNSFAGTTLDDELEKTGRKELILVGFMTHMCVSTTARAALDRGYRTTVVADATATRALPGAAGGGAVDAASLQAASLAALADRFAVIARAADDLGA